MPFTVTATQQAASPAAPSAGSSDLLGSRAHSTQDVSASDDYLGSLTKAEQPGEPAAAAAATPEGGAAVTGAQWSHSGDQRIRAQKIMAKVGWILFEKKHMGHADKTKSALRNAQLLMEMAMKEDQAPGKNATDLVAVDAAFHKAADAGRDALRLFEAANPAVELRRKRDPASAEPW